MTGSPRRPDCSASMMPFSTAGMNGSDHAAHDLVEEKARAALAGLDRDVAVAELAVAAGLLLVAPCGFAGLTDVSR